MLTQVAFTNFKSWASVEMACGSITGIFGANSSGKTSFLQFLLLLKQTKEATDRKITLALNGNYAELGLITDAIHNHDEFNDISWRVSFRLPKTMTISDPSDLQAPGISHGDTLTLRSTIRIVDKAPVARSLAYQLGNLNFELTPKSATSSAFTLDTVPETQFSFKRTKGRVWNLPGPVKSYAFPDQARTYYQNAEFLADLEAEYEAQIDRLFYLGPLREFPKRDYLWARSRPTDVGTRGEKAVDAILAATEANERRNIKRKGPLKPFQEMIAHWLREMGLIDSFTVREIAPGSNRWQAHVKTRHDGSDVLLTDVGFGVSQVLPVVTLLQYVPEGSTVILEQPEIYLHPLAQAGLADVLIQAAATRRVQVIIESHSEHLLLRLQRRIAEGVISAEDIKLYFCDTPKGSSELTQLGLDLFGNISNWPKDFMGDAFGETARAELARLRRIKAAQ